MASVDRVCFIKSTKSICSASLAFDCMCTSKQRKKKSNQMVPSAEKTSSNTYWQKSKLSFSTSRAEISKVDFRQEVLDLTSFPLAQMWMMQTETNLSLFRRSYPTDWCWWKKYGCCNIDALHRTPCHWPAHGRWQWRSRGSQYLHLFQKVSSGPLICLSIDKQAKNKQGRTADDDSRDNHLSISHG